MLVRYHPIVLDGLCECGCGLPAPVATRTDRAKGYVRGQPQRFVLGHNMMRRTPDDEPRLCGCGCGQLAAVKRGVARRFVLGHNPPTREITAADWIVEDCGYETPCWVWRRARSPLKRPRVTVRKRKLWAYRAFYEQEIGAIPPGGVLHHKCEVPACVRLDHLELLPSQSEHVRRHRPH